MSLQEEMPPLLNQIGRELIAATPGHWLSAQLLLKIEATSKATQGSGSDLGSLNDPVNHYQWRVEYEGGLSNCDLTGIIMSVNDMPQRRIGWQTSWDAVQGKLCPPNKKRGLTGRPGGCQQYSWQLLAPFALSGYGAAHLGR